MTFEYWIVRSLSGQDLEYLVFPLCLDSGIVQTFQVLTSSILVDGLANLDFAKSNDSGNMALAFSNEQIKNKDTLDFFIVLNTNTMTWEKGKYVGTPPFNRYGHSTTSIGPHLLIFGGWEYSRATNEVIVMRDITFSKSLKNVT
jgi:hypothetical protein